MSIKIMESILNNLTDDAKLTPMQIRFIRRKLERDIERNGRQIALRRQKSESFEREITDILESHPTIGFTATDIQFLIENFVDRHITNQKVAAHLHCLVEEGRVERRFVKHNTAIFFCGGNLAELYR